MNVMFDAAGGAVAPLYQAVIYNTYYGSLPTPTKTGYDFAGWYTSAVGGTLVTAATLVTATSDHYSYAHWTAKSNIEVSLNANGGSYATPSRFWVTYDNTYAALATAEAYRKGYSLTGWNTQAEGGATVTATSIVNDVTPHTLYAQWDINSYTMSYDSGGGSYVSSESVVYDTLATEPATPTRPGYSFDGWYTDTTYTIQWYFSTDKMTDSDVTLCAKWTALPPVFTSYPDKALNFNTAYTWLDEVAGLDYTGGPVATNIIVSGIADNFTGGNLATTTVLDTGTAGSYTVTYSMTNPQGATATVTRTIHVVRNAPGGGFYPEIITDDAYLSLNESYTWMTDVKAFDLDEMPHDITDMVLITSITDTNGNISTNSTLSTSRPNQYLVEYTVSDSDGNVTVATRTITVENKGGSSGGGSGSGGSGSSTTYTLTFDTNGGSTIAAVNKSSGTNVDLSAYMPIRDGYTFSGWYSDAALTTKVTYITLTKNTKVYAGWDLNADERGSNHEPYISGYSDGTFHPDSSITRAEVAQLLYNISGASGSGTNKFSDVPSGSWYYNAVMYLTDGGVISGYTDDTFKPDNSITRAEFVTLVAKYAELTEATGSSFSDVSSGHWASGYIAAATQAGYISGYTGGTFRPDNNITRAEAVTVLNAMLGRETGKDVLVGLTMPFSDVSSTHWAYDQILEVAVEHAHK